MKERKCAKCGASLTNEDVMKMKFEDGSWRVMAGNTNPRMSRLLRKTDG